VSTVYLSPIWASTPGSTHGYDVTDHARINPELGGLAGLRRFSAAAKELGLSVIVDFVPNHMGIQGGHNPYWEDVLRHGQGSRYAHFFDISWHPLKRALEGKVLLPTLGDQYGRVLERGELQLTWEEEGEAGRFFLRYGARRLPMSPRSVALLLGWVVDALGSRVPGEAQAELGSITRSIQTLPRSSDPDLSDVDRLSRAQEVEVGARRLFALRHRAPGVRQAMDDVLASVNADPQRLDQLVSEQDYRLAGGGGGAR
jgi:maltooligosyl trehalose synthase (EC 5.4.99.15)